jgi:hypothetical protein
MDTYRLSSDEGGMSWSIERKEAGEGYSRSGECRGGTKSGQQKNESEPGTLTAWRVRREGQVRVPKESERVRETHQLLKPREGRVRTAK